MLRAHITQIFILDNSYNNQINFFKRQNHSLISLTDKELIFEKNGNKAKFTLSPHEEDSFTRTLLSNFNDGVPFRVIRPIGLAKEMSLLKNNSKDDFSVGSLNPDGYAVTFFLTEKNDIRSITIQEKGIEEQLQKLISAALMSLQNNLHNDFYNISRRLIKLIRSNNINIHSLEYGTILADILKDNIMLYDENEKYIIANL